MLRPSRDPELRLRAHACVERRPGRDDGRTDDVDRDVDRVRDRPSRSRRRPPVRAPRCRRCRCRRGERRRDADAAVWRVEGCGGIERRLACERDPFTADEGSVTSGSSRRLGRVGLCDVGLCDVGLCDVGLCDVGLCGVGLGRIVSVASRPVASGSVASGSVASGSVASVGAVSSVEVSAPEASSPCVVSESSASGNCVVAFRRITRRPCVAVARSVAATVVGGKDERGPHIVATRP